jgi:hypothetical protein
MFTLGGESLHVHELLIAGNIANIYVRVGKRYFHFADSRLLTCKERVAKVKAVFPNLPPHYRDLGD